MTTGTDYNTAAAQILEQARTELDRGDTRQASEKGWGAAAQAVKAPKAEDGSITPMGTSFASSDC